MTLKSESDLLLVANEPAPAALALELDIVEPRSRELKQNRKVRWDLNA